MEFMSNMGFQEIMVILIVLVILAVWWFLF